MEKILLPTDFSDNALNAINYALNLYKGENCKFYLLNTYTPIIYNYDYRMSTSGYLGDVVDVIRENSKEKLDEIEKKLKEKFNNSKHQFETISSFSLLTDKIKDIVDEYAIDLIIMGTKGATGAKEVLFGTNTIHVIKKSKCPVLAVPDGFFFEEPKEILFPTDYKVDYSDKQIQNFKTIVNAFNSRVHILNVSHGIDLSETQNTNKAILEKLFTAIKHTSYRVDDKPIPQAINEFQKSTYIQLLVMINNKHSFFENLFFKPVINQIGFHLNIPFLVIPAKM
ncbi:MAG: universal stress protein [Flavobacteriaceae bacterium]|nr:universal stress protein [Flavobacteriaceae bacterium]